MQSHFSKYCIWMASSEGTMTISVIFKELLLNYSTENNFREEKNWLTDFVVHPLPPSSHSLLQCFPVIHTHIITSRMMMMMTTFRQDDTHRQNLTNTLLQDHSSRDCDTASF